jgi:hypothetical protein
MTARQRRKDDPSSELERLRECATPDWLSRIDRVNRFCISWIPVQCQQARAEGLIGRPLSHVQNRPIHQGCFPHTARAGDYFYVVTPYTGTLMVIARTRLCRVCEVSDRGQRRVTGFDVSEGTPIRLDLPVPPAVAARFSWHKGKRIATLPMSGTRLTTGAFVRLALILRLTSCTAADLDAVLRGDSLS